MDKSYTYFINTSSILNQKHSWSHYIQEFLVLQHRVESLKMTKETIEHLIDF